MNNPDKNRRLQKTTNSAMLNLHSELSHLHDLKTSKTTNDSKIHRNSDPYSERHTTKKKLGSSTFKVSTAIPRLTKTEEYPIRSFSSKSISTNVRDEEINWEHVNNRLSHKEQWYDYLSSTGGIMSSPNQHELAGILGCTDFMSKRYDTLMAEPTSSPPGEVCTQPNHSTASREIRDRYLNRDELSDAESLVEYVDDFGRSRTIARSLYEELYCSSTDEEELVEPTPLDVHHYDSNKEVRDLGAGYYRLDQDLETRMKQQSELNQLRAETIRFRQQIQIENENAPLSTDPAEPVPCRPSYEMDIGKLDAFLVRRVRLIVKHRIHLLGKASAQKNLCWTVGSVPFSVYEDLFN